MEEYLVEPTSLLQTNRTNSVKKAQSPQAIDVRRVLGALKGDLDVALGSQIVHFIRTNLGQDTCQIGGVSEVAVMEKHADACFVTVPIDMINPTSVEATGAADNSMNFIPL